MQNFSLEGKVEKMKILLVSDVHHFSTLDVYRGYVEAFKKLKVDFDLCEIHSLVRMSSVLGMTTDGAFGMCMAKMLNVDNGFTHILFVSGIQVPTWLLKSKYDKKVGVIALDDPHASKRLLDNKKYIDYYFTNEKTFEDINANILYVPTATSPNLPAMEKESIEENLRYDVLFVGTVYENRIKPLEAIAEYCKKNKLKMGIIGPLLNVHRSSTINDYSLNGILPNEQTKLAYRGSNVVLNIDRDVTWSAIEKEGNSELVYTEEEPYSINPRSYEIAGCKSTQLYINARKEAYDIFGDNIYYANDDSCVNVLDEILHTDKSILNKKIEDSFKVVKDNHLYLNRAIKILDFIKNKENV